MKKINKKNIFVVVVMILLLGFITSNAYKNMHKEESNNLNQKEIIDIEFESRVDKLNNFEYEDHFVLGWLQVQGTNIDMPIFTSILRILEEEEEVSPDFSYGWRNINYKIGENRMVLSAHNILNVSSKPLQNMEILSDFEPLMNFVYYDFAKENQYIKYTDEDGKENVYVIYAVGFANIEDEYYESIPYDDKDSLKKYIDDAKNNSIYDYEVDVNAQDEIMSLITCTRFFGVTGDTLFRIDVRKVREDETTYKHKVKENSNYENVKQKLDEESV